MAFEPYSLVESGIEVDIVSKKLRFTLGPRDSTDPNTYVTAEIKLADLPKAEPVEDKADKEVIIDKRA